MHSIVKAKLHFRRNSVITHSLVGNAFMHSVPCKFRFIGEVRITQPVGDGPLDVPFVLDCQCFCGASRAPPPTRMNNKQTDKSEFKTKRGCGCSPFCLDHFVFYRYSDCYTVVSPLLALFCLITAMSNNDHNKWTSNMWPPWKHLPLHFGIRWCRHL